MLDGAFIWTWSFHTTLDVEGNSIYCHYRILWSATCMWDPTPLWSWRKKCSLFQPNLRRSKGDKIPNGSQVVSENCVFFFLKWNDMDEEVCYKWNRETWLEYKYMRIWVSNFEVCVPIMEVVKVHWPCDECLSQWA